jgi:hypothetical protein
MSHSNIVLTTNENISSPKSTKKPLAFVQPRIRDSNSMLNTSEKLNQNQIPKNVPLTSQEPFSYVSQSRKLPMNKIKDFNHVEK